MDTRLILSAAAVLCLAAFASSASAKLPTDVVGEGPIQITDAAYSDKPIKSIGEGRKDKVFKAGEPIYACLKFSDRLRGRITFDEIRLSLSWDGGGFGMDAYKLTNEDLDKSEITILILPAELDLNIGWMKDAQKEFAKVAKSKQKIMCKLSLKYLPNQQRAGEITAQDQLTIDFSDGFGYKTAAVKRNPLKNIDEDVELKFGKLDADKKLTSAILEQTRNAIKLGNPIQYEDVVIERVIVRMNDWNYERNDFGVITSRWAQYNYLAKNTKSGECIWGYNNVYQENLGGDKYGSVKVNALMHGNLMEYSIPCDVYAKWLNYKAPSASSASDKKAAKGKK